MGIIGVLVFVMVNTRVKDPLLEMGLSKIQGIFGAPNIYVRGLFLKNKVFAFSNLAALINYSTTTGAVFLLSLYLQYILGYTPQRAGLVLLPLPLIMVIVSPVAGELSDKIDPRVLASIGMALTAVGLSFFIYVGFFTGLPYIILGQLVLGSGFAFFSSPNTNAIMGSVKKRNYGVASATASTMRLSGQVLSFGIVILIFSLLIGKVQITPDNYFNLLESIRVAFKVFAVACFIGIFTTAYGKIASL